MYAGSIVEPGSADKRFLVVQQHPYTRGLLRKDAPSLDRYGGEDVSIQISGSVPSSTSRRPAGCLFAPRCPHCDARHVPRARPPMFDYGGTTTRGLLGYQRSHPTVTQASHPAFSGPILAAEGLTRVFSAAGGWADHAQKASMFAPSTMCRSHLMPAGETPSLWWASSGCGESTLARPAVAVCFASDTAGRMAL